MTNMVLMLLFTDTFLFWFCLVFAQRCHRLLTHFDLAVQHNSLTIHSCFEIFIARFSDLSCHSFKTSQSQGFILSLRGAKNILVHEAQMQCRPMYLQNKQTYSLLSKVSLEYKPYIGSIIVAQKNYTVKINSSDFYLLMQGLVTETHKPQTYITNPVGN